MKKISPIIICVCVAFAICVSAVGSADGINSEQATESVSEIISVEGYLIALYESVHNTELTDEADITEVLVWAEANAILEGISDDTQSISEIPLTQETALVMLSRSYTELAQITDMITEVSLTANSRQPHPGMPAQAGEHIPDMGNAENAKQPALSENGGFPQGGRQPQMPKAEASDETQRATRTTAEISGFTENEQMNSASLSAQPAVNTAPDTKNEQAPQRNVASAGGRPASDIQGNQDRPQGENMQLPYAEKNTDNQKKSIPTENTQTKQTEQTEQTKQTESPDSRSKITKLLEEMEREAQTTEALETEVSNAGLNEHIKEYLTAYIGLLILAAAFVFVKLFRRSRY